MRILLACFIILSSFFSSVCFGQVTHRDLQGFAKTAVDEKYFNVCPPKFVWKNDYLEYDLGQVDVPCILKDTPENIMIPLRAQLQIALIRKTRSRPTQRRFWEPVLLKVEQQVEDMLLLINRGNLDKQQLFAILGMFSESIDGIYQKNLDRLAKNMGRGGAKRGVARTADVPMTSVPATTSAPEANYRALDYRGMFVVHLVSQIFLHIRLSLSQNRLVEKLRLFRTEATN